MKKAVKKIVLIAEDDPGIIEVMSIVLQDAGYTVITAETKKKILESITLHNPHLLLLDIWLSGENGEIIARELKNTAATKLLPIIIISANTQTEAIAKASGADAFLAKPFDIDELVGMVSRYISQ